MQHQPVSRMDRAEYLAFHKQFCDAARELSARKNNDYAGSGGQQPFANFERVEAMGVCSTEQGFLVRMIDKLSRLATFTKDGKLLVADEGPLDTLRDVVNYAVLFAARLEDQRRQAPPFLVRAGALSPETLEALRGAPVGASFVVEAGPTSFDGGIDQRRNDVWCAGADVALSLETTGPLSLGAASPECARKRCTCDRPNQFCPETGCVAHLHPATVESNALREE